MLQGRDEGDDHLNNNDPSHSSSNNNNSHSYNRQTRVREHRSRCSKGIQL